MNEQYRQLAGDSMACPYCGAQDLLKEWMVQTFPYGSDEDCVQLSARVPAVTCANCGIQLDADGAEELRHEAVCAHLHRLNPREIKEIRAKLNLTQEGLAAEGRFGIASIRRWETGRVIQDAGNDVILRIIRDPEGRAMLRRVLDRDANMPERPVSLVFQRIDPRDPVELERAASFEF